MANELLEIFERIKVSQRKQKDIKTSYRDALELSGEYKKINEELKNLKEKKKNIEREIRENFSNELDELDNLREDIKNDRELMSDIALSTLMKGQSIELKDKEDNEYEPVFNVKFKKI